LAGNLFATEQLHKRKALLPALVFPAPASFSLSLCTLCWHRSSPPPRKPTKSEMWAQVAPAGGQQKLHSHSGPHLLSSIKLSAAGQLRFTLTPRQLMNCTAAWKAGPWLSDPIGPTACLLSWWIYYTLVPSSFLKLYVCLFVLALHKAIFTCPQRECTWSQFNFMSNISRPNLFSRRQKMFCGEFQFHSPGGHWQGTDLTCRIYFCFGKRRFAFVSLSN